MASTEEILNHHLKCVLGGDLEGVLSDYAMDAVFFTTKGVHKGPAEMRRIFTALLADFGQPGLAASVHCALTEGDCAYIVWSAETPANVYEPASDTFVMRNGKIIAQSFAGKVTPKLENEVAAILG